MASLEKLVVQNILKDVSSNQEDNKHLQAKHQKNNAISEDEYYDTLEETSFDNTKRTENNQQGIAANRRQDSIIEQISLVEEEDINVSDNNHVNNIDDSAPKEFFNIILIYAQVPRNIRDLSVVKNSLMNRLNRKFVHLIIAYYRNLGLVVQIGLHRRGNMRRLNFNIKINGIKYMTTPIYLDNERFVDDLYVPNKPNYCDPPYKDIIANVSKIPDIQLINLHKLVNNRRAYQVNYNDQVSLNHQRRKIWLYGPSITGKISLVNDKLPGIYKKDLNDSWAGYRNQERIYVVIDQKYCSHLGSLLLKLLDDKFMKDFRRLRTVIFICEVSIEQYFKGQYNSFMDVFFYNCEKIKIRHSENVAMFALGIICNDKIREKFKNYYS